MGEALVSLDNLLSSVNYTTAEAKASATRLIFTLAISPVGEALASLDNLLSSVNYTTAEAKASATRLILPWLFPP
ncbi:hypothetical protein [Syntrophomonas zehnderi]|uniref:hypothetical protein n=1 Tax=Syntrophomonas zehnderi TaxID=404335 RepID=UPI000624F86D|nr:hypothetical protein [Syntrophomonas zehnderi]